MSSMYESYFKGKWIDENNDWLLSYPNIIEYFELENFDVSNHIFVKDLFVKNISQRTLTELKSIVSKILEETNKVNHYRKVIENALNEVNKFIFTTHEVDILGHIFKVESLKSVLTTQSSDFFHYAETLNQRVQITQNEIDKRENFESKEEKPESEEKNQNNELSKYSLDDLLAEIKRRFENKLKAG